MNKRKQPAVKSIIIADAREISGKTVRQIQEHIALKYSQPYENKEIADTLANLVDAGIVTLKGRAYIVSPVFLHGGNAKKES